ncbi:MAG: serine hydrolase [Phycisphaeraceae bacterium]
MRGTVWISGFAVLWLWAVASGQVGDDLRAAAREPMMEHRADRVIDYEHLGRADAAIEAAIQRGELPGAVLYVGDREGVFYRKAYGDRSVVPERVGMGINTIFDLASLTKPIATATAIHILIDEGKIELDAPASDYLPVLREKDANGRITIRELLLHHSGLPPANPMSDYEGDRETMIANVASCALRGEPGDAYAYSCLGYILLGQIVAEVSGQALDVFVTERVFEPLGMTDTGYNPGPAYLVRTAPTEVVEGEAILGRVHDPRAWALGGVSGNAGLFSTGRDVARYARMILNRGQLEGARVMSEAAVERMLTPASLADGTGWRTLGFDARGSATSARGAVMDRESSVGHTGYTGTAVWIDPKNDLFYVLLTNRVHPSDAEGKAAPVRRDVATLVGAAVLGIAGDPGKATKEARFLTPRPREHLEATAFLPEGFVLRLPYKGGYEVGTGYGHQASSWTHNTIGRDSAANDYFAIDFEMPGGTEVRAAAAGRVMTSQDRTGNDGYGQYVVIDHGHGVTTIYAHLSERRFGEVSYGEPEVRVEAGEVIGLSGDSGTSWPHLHFAAHTGSRLSHSGADVGGKATVPEPIGGYYGVRKGQVLSGGE